jgi:hypothetical protein
MNPKINAWHAVQRDEAAALFGVAASFRNQRFRDPNSVHGPACATSGFTRLRNWAKFALNFSAIAA